jgi:hypothetical protein
LKIEIKYKILYGTVYATFCSLLIIYSYGCQKNEQSIYGVWYGEHNNYKLKFHFDEDQTCVLSFKDKESGVAETFSGNYEIDFTKEPVTLSIRKIPKLNYPLHTIIDFINDDSIKVANFSMRWRLRPVSFIPKKSMILQRTIDNTTVN